MYTLLVTGDVPGAATYFNPLLQQTIIPCTSGTRPSSPNDGMAVWETDTERYSSYNATLGAWVALGQMISGTYTPVITAATTNPTLGTGSSATAKYSLWGGKLCTAWGRIVWGSSGGSAGSGQYFVTLPPGITSSSTAPNLVPGAAMFRDDSSGTISPGVCYVGSGVTSMSLTSTSGIVGSGTPWVWANLDYLSWSVTFEIA